MKPTKALIILATSLALAASLRADPPADKLRQKPITTESGKVGELLKQWWKEGTAAGNAGDYYDNRDGDHSPLNLAPWPQLSAIKYSPEDVKFRRHWAAQRIILPHVTFGNSSTSAPPTLGGSNPRMYYTTPSGLAFLYKEYTSNNLYIYPEHRDHDPGHNGKNDGFGDMYPTNTPYLMISQGSSGSDQPFMRMMPFVLASFRPEVKKKLTEANLLMPTIQMLWRSTNKHLKDPKEYLTGKAHPTVFEGSWVDELAMVQKAHALELKALPPMVQLRVLEEDKATNGIDYFDLANSEILADTPACIARIHRGKAQKKRMVVDASASYDLNKSPLTFTWVVLRGDSAKIKITPKKDDQSVVEISVAYHERRPITPASPMESNRVDIGVFVHNGTHYSAPGFVTVQTLDRESRTYDDDGKILEIAHGMGETDLRVTDWEKLSAHLTNDRTAHALLQLNDNQKSCYRDMAEFLRSTNGLLTKAQGEIKNAEAELKSATDNTDKDKAKKNLDAARERVTKLQKGIQESLDQQDKRLADSVRHFTESRLANLVHDPLFAEKQRDWLKEMRTPANEPRFKAQWQKLARWGLAKQDETLMPLRSSKTATKFELAQLESMHAAFLAELAFPGMLQNSYQVNFVDQRLSAPREWRDLYDYDAKGQCIGWTRYSTDGKQEFNFEGLLIVEKDAKGRCVKGRTVRYAQEPSKGKGFNPNQLRAIPGETIVLYTFESDDDRRGRRAGTEPVVDEKKK